MLKFGPVAALTFSATAVLLLALAPLGSRLGWWHYRFGLHWLMPSSGYLAAIAVILSVGTLALGWSQLSLRGRIMLTATFVLGAALAYVPWHYHRIRASLPPIHDITTDTDNPPSFHAVLPARTAENAGSVAYDNPQLPELQKNAYPDLAPIKAALSWSEAFDRALYVAKTMPGWTIVASDPDADRIEAKPAKSLVRIH